MSGAAAPAEDHKKEGDHPAPPDHAKDDHAKKEGGAQENGLYRILNAPVVAVKGIGKGIWSIIKGTAKRAMAVADAGWLMTGGQVTGELGEMARRAGIESKEKGLNAVAAVIEYVNCKVANVVGGAVSYAGSAPGRIIGRGLRGVQGAVVGAVTGKGPGASTSSDVSHGADHPSTPHAAH